MPLQRSCINALSGTEHKEKITNRAIEFGARRDILTAPRFHFTLFPYAAELMNSHLALSIEVHALIKIICPHSWNIKNTFMASSYLIDSKSSDPFS